MRKRERGARIGRDHQLDRVLGSELGGTAIRIVADQPDSVHPGNATVFESALAVATRHHDHDAVDVSRELKGRLRRNALDFRNPRPDRNDYMSARNQIAKQLSRRTCGRARYADKREAMGVEKRFQRELPRHAPQPVASHVLATDRAHVAADDIGSHARVAFAKSWVSAQISRVLV